MICFLLVRKNVLKLWEGELPFGFIANIVIFYTLQKCFIQSHYDKRF